MQAKTLPRILLAIGAVVTSVAIAADFNSDGKQDVLWRLPSGKPLIWWMSGLAVTAQQALPMGLGAEASIVGTGNFFGTGDNTIAWVDSTGQLRLWEIGAGGGVVQNCVATSSIDPTWKFLSIADIDNDGRDDVLWQLEDGRVVALPMNGCTASAPLYLGIPADPAWTFSGSSHVSGTTRTGLFWTNAGNSNVIAWSVSSAGDVTQLIVPAAAQTGWSLCVVGDFDGDQRVDLLWRSPDGTALTLWLNQGNSYTATPVTAASANVFGVADGVFANGFDFPSNPAPPLGSDWSVLRAADYDGDGKADLLLANAATGESAVWLMNGASVQATARFAPNSDMPLPGLTGWSLPLDRPTVTKTGGQVSVDWNPLPGNAQYTVYASATNAPADTGSVVSDAPPPLSFGRSDAGYADKRYFAVSANYYGLKLPPSKEAYIVEFAPFTSPMLWGFLSVTDLNGDGCPDIFRVLGDCHGNFGWADENAIGLGPLYDDVGLRCLYFADFNGDGVPDIVANVYTCDAAACGGPTPDSRVMLFFGNGDGSYTQAPGFNSDDAIGGGYGETIVVADFNNDGCLDIYVPRYTAYDASEHDLLLINDCHGGFVDLSDAAGVAMRNIPLAYRPEGAQAIDINGDGWIDLYVGSHLFLNNGDLTFTDVGGTAAAGGSEGSWNLPTQFDEGAKFIDCDNSGQPCLVLNATDKLRVFKFDGVAQFTELGIVPAIYMNESWGLNAADVDGDGRSDLMVAGGIDQSVETGTQYATLRAQLAASKAEGDIELDDTLDTAQTPNAMPQLLVNRGSYVAHDFYDDGRTPTTRPWNDLQTFGDFDFSGTTDLVTRSGYAVILMNQAHSDDVINVSVLGRNGEQNQQGRVVRVTPDARPDVTMLQIVDSGSGYMANGPYDLTFATPYFGAYTISVRFADATYTAVARSGDHVSLYADGTATIRPRQ